MSKALLALALLLIVCVGLITTSGTHAFTGIPQNNRTFYLGSSGMLGSSRPTSAGPPSNANLTKGPIDFSLPPLQSSATFSGQLSFSIWASWFGNTSVPAKLVGTFSYRYPAQSWTNTSSTPYALSALQTNNVSLTFSITAPSLIEQSSVMVEISAVSFPRHANITLSYGTSQYPSLVVLPMSGYQALFPANTLNILDNSLTPTTYFSLGAAPGNNIVVVKLLVSSALGFTDISRVNMTILDPNSRPVSRGTNVTMQPSAPSNPTGPFEYIASWIYSGNSTQGTYQVLIDIINIQNQVAFAFNGPASFGLVPPGFVPFPYNLIPYFVVGGVGAVGGVGGAVLYRKNRRKNYLIPFDHFNTLTGGELSGGTVVTVEGNTGSGKSLLLEQLMSEDLRNGRPCVFVTTGDFPNNIRANLKTLGLDISGYEQNGLLTFVDGYSAEAGQESREKISIPSLGDLTTLGIKITSALPSSSFKGGSLYFDSLTPLASKAKPESIVSFVQSVGARVKGLAGKAFFTVGLGIDGSVQRQLEDTADCIVQMEAFEESGTRRRRLRIAKFRARKHQEGWALFTIEDGKGIIFYSKKPRK